MDVSLIVDDQNFLKGYEKMQQQVPFTNSTAINACAVNAQTDIRAHMHDAFTIRRSSFMDRTIKISKFAKKTDQEAIVTVSPPGGVAPDFLTRHEDGGTMTPRGNSFAIPTDEIRPNINTVISKGKRPRNLPGAFVKKNKAGKPMLMYVKGRGKNRKLVAAYLLQRSITLKPRLKFEETGLASINRNWQRNVEAAWSKAVSTAK